MRTVGSWIGSAISALVTPSVLPKAGDGGAPGSFSYLAGLTAIFFSKRFVQEKLDVGLVPDTLVVRKLPGGGNIFAGQPNGYRQKLLRPLGFSQDVIQRDRLALTHGKAQVRLDLRPMLIPPGRFFSFVVEGRNNQFLPGHDCYTPLSVKYSFLVRRSASQPVIARILSLRTVKTNTRTRSVSVVPTAVHRSSPSTTSWPRNAGPLRNNSSTSEGSMRWRARCEVFSSSQSTRRSGVPGSTLQLYTLCQYSHVSPLPSGLHLGQSARSSI